MCECSHKMNIINPYPVIMNDRKVLETKNSVAKMCGNPVVFQHFVVIIICGKIYQEKQYCETFAAFKNTIPFFSLLFSEEELISGLK